MSHGGGFDTSIAAVRRRPDGSVYVAATGGSTGEIGTGYAGLGNGSTGEIGIGYAVLGLNGSGAVDRTIAWLSRTHPYRAPRRRSGAENER